MNSTLDLNRVLKLVMTGMQKVFSFDQIALIVMERDRGVVRCAEPIGAGFTPEMIERFKQFEIPVEETRSAFVASASGRQRVYLSSILPGHVEQMHPTDRFIYEAGASE